MNRFHLLCAMNLYPCAAMVSGCEVQLASETTEQVGSHDNPVVFGVDNRIEYVNIPEVRLKSLADSVAGMFVAPLVSCTPPNCTLAPLAPPAGGITQASHPATRPYCSSVPFQNQFGGAWCTAFLVGPDLFATAGHCLAAKNAAPTCNQVGGAFKVVFGFHADAAGNSPNNKVVPSSDVYTCTGTPVGAHTDAEDWAFFKVDRVVAGRIPLISNHAGPLRVSEEHVVYGFPHSVPLKMARDSWIKVDNPLDAVRIGVLADTFPGNSGGPIINIMTGVAVGFASYGADWDYVDVFGSPGNPSPCAAVNVCSMTSGCPSAGVWNGYTRMTWAAQQGKLPLHSALVLTTVL